MKPNDKVNNNILFLITTPYIHHPKNDQNTPVSFVKHDLETLDKNLFSGDGIVLYFLQWMSLQSNKISVIGSILMSMNQLNDNKSNKVGETISIQNLILVPICDEDYWYIYLFIRFIEKSFMIKLLDSFFKQTRPEFTDIVVKWFESSKDVKRNKITLTYENIELPYAIRQTDGHSCRNFVCLFSYITSTLSMKYVSIDDWFSSFNDKIK